MKLNQKKKKKELLTVDATVQLLETSTSTITQALGSYTRKDAALPLSSKNNHSQKKMLSLILINACFI